MKKFQKMGINYDIREDIYNEVQSFDMNTLIDFHNNYKSRKKQSCNDTW